MILGKTPPKAIEWGWGSKIYLANFLYIEAIFDSEMVPKDVNVNVSAIFAIFSSKNGGQGAKGRSKLFQKFICFGIKRLPLSRLFFQTVVRIVISIGIKYR